MDVLGAAAAALLSLAPVSGKLDGTWIETVQAGDAPRAVLHFEGKKLRFENLYGAGGTAEYKVIEKRAGSIRIRFEFSYEITKPSGRVVTHEAAPEFLYHEEDGKPVLSEMGFEYDGRGQVVLSEYLREDDLTDGFRSELCRRLNDRPAPSAAR
ncbi:MAG: hypothetical protein J5855_03630 [Mailhella sp.]|nr:hypothetical protein [Mailhella sp.]